jgi:2-polyprenyl-3-methyl-5-hydroxy-6-metoxy-1,4-benzoquinol methylase
LNNFHIFTANKELRQNGNFNFWISMIKDSQMLLEEKIEKNVLDFGCGDGGLLQLFDLMDNLDIGLGIDLDKQLIKQAIINNEKSNIDYKVSKNDTLKKYNNYFDVAYSQEVIYTIKDLKSHANEIFNSLKNGGYYFATIGSHIDNPLWSKRRQLIRDEEEYYAYDYSIEEIANIFYDIGFEVSLKRLPVDYPLIYNPKATKEFSNSLLDLVNTSYENKMIFSFWKPYEKR